jgi:hypothetical protein
MQVFTDQETCESLLQEHDASILDAHYYKRLLNSHLQPDEFLFFKAGGHVLPAVARNRLVTFYGGTRHNAANRLPPYEELLNGALDYLVRRGYRFQLVSILNDVRPLLAEDLRRFDVPYTAEWHYADIRHYSPERLVEGRAGKQLWSWKRVFRNSAGYRFETIDFPHFAERFDDLMRAHATYFAARGKRSVWSGSESLLLQILTEFHRRHRLLIRLISQAGEPRALYTIVHNASEMIYYFGGSLSPADHYVSKVMYLDLLEQARAIAAGSGIDSLNGLAGAFANKKVFGFTPRPLYALVNDPAWIVRTDPDLETIVEGHSCAP